MNTRTIASTLAGLVALGAIAMATLMIGLLLTDPIKVADAAGSRNVASLFHAVVGAIVQAVSALVRYL